jgi:hypothetical protein
MKTHEERVMIEEPRLARFIPRIHASAGSKRAAFGKIFIIGSTSWRFLFPLRDRPEDIPLLEIRRAAIPLI